MRVRDMAVVPCPRSEIVAFIEMHHYSKSINGCNFSHGFKLIYDGGIVGAAFFGRLAMANQWKRFSDVESDVIELRRLCCIDDTPKNTESFFIGGMLRWLKTNTGYRVVVSYADHEHGHTGVIYKASNFEYLGKQRGAKVIDFNGRTYHDKALRTKYKGNLKPFAKTLNAAIDSGAAVFRQTAGKHTFVYYLKPLKLKQRSKHEP